MWTHYASEHRGFVIGFDSSSDWLTSSEKGARSGFMSPRKIRYSKLRPKRHYSKLFYKSENWRYEKEWRVLFPLSECFLLDADSQLYVKEFNPSSIVSIILGCRIVKEDRIQIFKLMNRFPNAKLYRSFPNKNKFAMDIIPFDAAYHLPYFGAWRDGKYDMVPKGFK